MYTNIITEQFLLDKILSRICFFLNQTLNTYNMYVVDSEDFKDLVPNLFLRLLSLSQISITCEKRERGGRNQPVLMNFQLKRNLPWGILLKGIG